MTTPKDQRDSAQYSERDEALVDDPDFAAAAREMAEALQAATNYVQAAYRMSLDGSGSSMDRLRHVLEKAVEQVVRSNRAYGLIRDSSRSKQSARGLSAECGPGGE